MLIVCPEEFTKQTNMLPMSVVSDPSMLQHAELPATDKYLEDHDSDRRVFNIRAMGATVDVETAVISDAGKV